MEKSKPIPSSKPSSGTVISLQQGKLPPQAIELEEAVLGAMLIDKKGVDEVIDLLEPEAFYKSSHKNIFESIFRLFQNSQPIDLLTVSADLRKMENWKVLEEIITWSILHKKLLHLLT